MDSINFDVDLSDVTSGVFDIIQDEVKILSSKEDTELQERLSILTAELSKYEMGAVKSGVPEDVKFYISQANRQRLILDSLRREIEYEKSVDLRKSFTRILERTSELVFKTVLETALSVR